LGQPNDREAKTCTLSAMYVYMYILIDEGVSKTLRNYILSSFSLIFL